MNSERSINTVHPYPCKFPAWSVAEFLRGGGEVLLDPFCGSGTTVLEAAFNGWRHVVGFDSNPIATLITRFKLSPADSRFLALADSLLADMVLGAVLRSEPCSFRFEGRNHWFEARTLRELTHVVGFIRSQDRSDITDWLSVSLSRIINRVSRQEGETRYVAVDKPTRSGETVARFVESCGLTLTLLKERGPLAASARVESIDVLGCIPLEDASVDKIVTSPPYANTMDYYLYHKQRMNVLGYDFKAVQNAEIGSRHEYSSLKAPAQKWEADYGRALAECSRVLRPGGEALVIIGDSQIAGRKIDAAVLTRKLATALGFTIEVLESTPMDGRSRSFSRGFQRPNKHEHILRLVAPTSSTTDVSLRRPRRRSELHVVGVSG